jgi:hypothetical protein
MFDRTNRLCSFTFTALLALALFARPAAAQLCIPDSLDVGPCCAPASATLPPFPAMSQSVKFICFDGCNPVLNVPYCVDISTPFTVNSGGAIVCGAYRIRFRVKTCGTTTVLWNGMVNAYYSRNWQVSTPPPAGVNLTVWRFVINGDFLPTPSLPNNPLQKPACTSNFPRVYFTGYIDYALDCTTNTWQVAWNVNHECDGIHHQPGTARPAPSSGLHPTRSFSFVGPGAGFVVSSANTSSSNGPITQQAVRYNNWANSPSICTYEEAATGTFQATNAFCLCAVGGSNQYVSTNVTATGACGSAVTPSPLFGFYQKRLGTWTNQNVYPARQALLFDFGYLAYQNGCTGVFTQEWFEGAETLRGYPAVDFSGVALGTQFEDLASASTSPTNQATRIGAPHVSYYMLNFNMP